MFPDRLALVAQGVELTYRQLYDRVIGIARSLADAGISRGDRVAYLLGNNAASVIVYHAVQMLGAVSVPLNKRLLSNDIAFMLVRVKARALFFDSDIEKAVRQAVGDARYGGLLVMCGGSAGEGIRSWDDFKSGFANGSDEALFPVEASPESESLILFTSGTTGHPKAVVRMAKEVSALSAVQLMERDSAGEGVDVLYTQAPLFHLGGFLAMLKSIASGATLIIESHFKPDKVFELIDRYSVNQIYMIPPILFKRLFSAMRDRERTFPTVLEAQCAGGKVSDDVVEAVFALFPNARLRVSFGSSESGALCTGYISREHYTRRPDHAFSVGRANALVEIKLVDKEGVQVKPGLPGEALVKSPMTFAGYLGEDGRIVQERGADGYYRTEDIFRLDEEGYYTFSGRTRDMIKSGGENVYAAEVERVISQLPGIDECAVVGVPDELYGEGIAAAVVLSSGIDSIDPENLVAFCKERMPSFQKPRYLAVLPDLPRNSIGKVKKSALQENLEIFQPLFSAD